MKWHFPGWNHACEKFDHHRLTTVGVYVNMLARKIVLQWYLLTKKYAIIIIYIHLFAHLGAKAEKYFKVG